MKKKASSQRTRSGYEAMSVCVIDTSAIMAYLNQEKGADTSEDWLDQGAAISALCIHETMANLVRKNIDRESALEMIEALGLDTFPLDFILAVEGGALIAVTQSKGLSHGDSRSGMGGDR
ncbi:PIN domain-containing protein [Neorhizobium lilium]|uniref:PIN domain-containing protein n=1 Tax=Neorhizobium lilium TaxID=2503024 RepID=UPI00197D67FE|nr:PIN domain-containing protein [Neorhizobium lilium]